MAPAALSPVPTAITPIRWRKPGWPSHQAGTSVLTKALIVGGPADVSDAGFSDFAGQRRSLE